MSKIINGIIEKVNELSRWVDDRVKATAFAGIRFTLPDVFTNILPNLGMATVICFAVTIVTGLFLLFYYKPTPWSAAYDSIRYISENVAFGHLFRGLHYQASNGMVLLAIAHAAYVYFKRLYKGRFDFLWVTGVILGVATVLVAFTGYNLIFNDRAVEAQNIMLGITEAMHPLLKSLIEGTGLTDRALRIYALHIGIIPAIMMSFMAVHFPRALKISWPSVFGILGVLFIVTGLYPAELGPKFDPAAGAEFMPPEWYFLWVFAFLRTWAPVIIAGVVIPGALVIIMMGVPWLDKARSPRITDRPLFAILGMSAIAYWVYLTIRGTSDLGPPILQISPYETVGVLIITIAASSAVFHIITPWLKRSPRRSSRRAALSYLSGKKADALLLGIVGLQASLVLSFMTAYTAGQANLVAIDIGLILIALGMSMHVYSSASQKK